MQLFSCEESTGNLVILLDLLNHSIGMPEMCYERSKCKVLLQNLVVKGEELDEVDGFSYLDNSISPRTRISDGMSSRMQKTRLGLVALA